MRLISHTSGTWHKIMAWIPAFIFICLNVAVMFLMISKIGKYEANSSFHFQFPEYCRAFLRKSSYTTNIEQMSAFICISVNIALMFSQIQYYAQYLAKFQIQSLIMEINSWNDTIWKFQNDEAHIAYIRHVTQNYGLNSSFHFHLLECCRHVFDDFKNGQIWSKFQLSFSISWILSCFLYGNPIIRQISSKFQLSFAFLWIWPSFFSQIQNYAQYLAKFQIQDLIREINSQNNTIWKFQK